MAKKKANKKDLIRIDNKVYKKEAFMIEEDHPAIGRILNIEGMKFKILDDEIKGPHRMGTFITKLTELDEERMEEYDRELEELSEKLVSKVDIKRLIKENMKNKPHQDIKTGLFILRAQDNGEEVEEEHSKGCYQFTLHHKNQMFTFISGCEIPRDGVQF